MIKGLYIYAQDRTEFVKTAPLLSYNLGPWRSEFTKNTGIVQDAVTAVDIDDERTALVLVSLTPDGNICTERTYYAMICEIDATACKVTFHVTDDVA